MAQKTQKLTIIIKKISTYFNIIISSFIRFEIINIFLKYIIVIKILK